MGDIGPDGWERFATPSLVDWYLTTDDGGCSISNGRWRATLTPAAGRDPDGLWPLTAAGRVESIAEAKAEAKRALELLRAMRDLYAKEVVRG